jgi:uncharacterized protein
MKIEQTLNEGNNAFTGYGDGYVEVGGKRHASSLVVSAKSLTEGWAGGSIEQLTEAHFRMLAEMAPEIVLLGSGKAFAFPDPSLLAPLHTAGIGVEVMDTRAACRTYNLLLGEGRNVIAALIVD